LAESLYQSLVVDRARRPLHGGAIEAADGAGEGSNPLCGDRVEVTLRLGADGRIGTIRHRSRACAICAAAADLMADSVDGRGREEIQSLRALFGRMMEDGAEALDATSRERLGLLLAFSDLHEYRSRRKCAALPWSALDAALQAGYRTGSEASHAAPDVAIIVFMQGEGHGE